MTLKQTFCTLPKIALIRKNCTHANDLASMNYASIVDSGASVYGLFQYIATSKYQCIQATNALYTEIALLD